MGNFVAIDFETATAQRNSACAVGYVVVDDWKLVDSGSWLIQPPENKYDAFNTMIHGLSASDTKGKPSFAEIWPEVEAKIGSRVVVAHNSAFDMSVLRQSAAATGCRVNDLQFACTYRMAKATWPNRWSYKLSDLAEEFGIELNHHEALSDALAAGELLAHICNEHEVTSIEELSKVLGFRIGQLIQGDYGGFSNAKTASGAINIGNLQATTAVDDESHQLFGKLLVFTGTLQSMTRNEAAQLAVNCGAKASNTVSKKVSYLVVGMTDFAKVKDGSSSKMRRAVELADEGSGIEIIDEGDFFQMLDG
jgi:DNA polymerase-3 subunit epsilon